MKKCIEIYAPRGSDLRDSGSCVREFREGGFWDR